MLSAVLLGFSADSRFRYLSQAKIIFLRIWRGSFQYFFGHRSGDPFPNPFLAILDDFGPFWGALRRLFGVTFIVFFLLGHASAPSKDRLGSKVLICAGFGGLGLRFMCIFGRLWSNLAYR